ncbi:MAG: alpha/beta hydrolase, partial [Pseudomonadota bacterium]
MSAWLVRILVFTATFYLAALAILFVFQDRFIFPAPQDRHAPAAGFQEAEVTTADGLDLIVHWRPPEEGRPVVAWFHGNAGSLAASANETRTLAREGYGLLLASYRGYGGNPGSPSEAGFYEDGRAAMGLLRAQGVDPDDTIIASNSIGSGTAVQMASEYDHAALMMVAPFSSLTDVAAQAMPIFPVRLLLRHRFENAEKLRGIESPILILHGDADQV